MNNFSTVKGQLIVSCQALEDEPLHSSFIMAKMALAAKDGGASGIRANSVEDIEAIKAEIDLPIIGIIKKEFEHSQVRITPTLEEIEALYKVGVEVIAFDATIRKRPDGLSLEQFIKIIRKKYPEQLFMADVSTVEEARIAQKLGIDIVATTLVGYTEYTIGQDPLVVLEAIIKAIPTKVIAEGNINSPEKARKALELGAYAVVVGSAITRPQLITKQFISEMIE